MNEQKTQEMIAKLLNKTTNLKYGTVSVTVKLHDGRVVQVTYSTNEHTKDFINKKETVD
jgi:hypothetical protein